MSDSFFSRSETGDLIQRCTSDVGTIHTFLSTQMLDIGRIMVMIAMVIPMMFAISVKMAVLSLATVPAVDTKTEGEIVRALERKHGDVTTLLVTHRLSCCLNTDRILVFEDGELVKQGTHNQLVEEEGFYKRLWEIQKGIENEAFQEIADED
ncbi:MAG: hypothetical protein GY866_09205 [Proteobacteria bacterium]|nr:hypothetical protein [Pseudomonadota bacterium]